MEEILMIDAAERYLNGQMSQEERIYFEQLRQTNPEVDRIIAENIYFIQEMQQFSDIRKLKSNLEMARQNTTSNSGHQPEVARITPISIWRKYRKTAAVAASITVFSTVLCASLLTNYNKKNQPNIKPLVEKINEQDQKYKSLELQVGKLNMEASEGSIDAKPKISSNFRATGFIIDAAANYVVTNAHVISEATHKLIVENNHGEQYDAKVVYVDPNTDMAIIEITDPEFKPLDPAPYTLAKTNSDIGESIFTLGYPKQEIVYGEGYVSAENGYDMDTSFFQLSTAANEGNSGSPVINKDGKVIGVISSAETDAEGVVFAIKSKYIIEAMEKINPNKRFANEKNNLKNTDRINQIKKVQNYIFMIKGN